MDAINRQIYTLQRSDPSLSAEDIAASLGVSADHVRVLLAAPSAADLPLLLAASKNIALDPAQKGSTRQAAIEWLTDELTGRNAAKARNLNANTDLSVQLIAALETAKTKVPDSVRRRQILNVTPAQNAETFVN